MDEKTGVRCVVCKKGGIVRRKVFHPRENLSEGEMVIGGEVPGSHETISIFCERCGVKYEFVPML